MLRKVQARVEGHDVVLEVADTAEARSIGLSNRHELPDGTGMLFVFEGPDFHTFWMKDTYIPLAIYWLDSMFSVVDAAAMYPGDPNMYRPAITTRYAVELPLIWAAEAGIGEGSLFQFV